MYTLVSMMAHKSGRLDTPRFQGSPRGGHEAPELLHLDDPIDGQAHRLGIRIYTERLSSLPDGLGIDEEGLSRVPCRASGPLAHSHTLAMSQAYFNRDSQCALGSPLRLFRPLQVETHEQLEGGLPIPFAVD